MSGVYTLKVVSDFAAAHSLRGYAGACQRLHGHNWKVEIEAKSSKLDDIGIAIDFKILKAYTLDISSRLDHYYLNDIPPFDKINPTAENIARYFYSELNKLLADDKARVVAVTIWETDRAAAKYSEN